MRKATAPRVSQVLEVGFAQPESTATLLEEHMNACLSTLHELLQYSLLLQTSHYAAAALLSCESTRADTVRTQAAVMERLQQEWEYVLKLEKTSGTNSLIATQCPHTTWQPYREVMTMTESQGFRLTEQLKLFLASYFPPVQSSSNIEDVFNEVQDSVKRSGKADNGSLSNMCAVAIRSVLRKIQGSSALKGSNLQSEDWEGNSVRAIKANVFQPQSCPPRILAETEKAA